MLNRPAEQNNNIPICSPIHLINMKHLLCVDYYTTGDGISFFLILILRINVYTKHTTEIKSKYLKTRVNSIQPMWLECGGERENCWLEWL